MVCHWQIYMNTVKKDTKAASKHVTELPLSINGNSSHSFKSHDFKRVFTALYLKWFTVFPSIKEAWDIENVWKSAYPFWSLRNSILLSCHSISIEEIFRLTDWRKTVIYIPSQVGNANIAVVDVTFLIHFSLQLHTEQSNSLQVRGRSKRMNY